LQAKHRDTDSLELQEPSLAGLPWPELRIVRLSSPIWPHSEDWDTFLNDIGRRNYGKGKAVALGSLACTYVTATEMGRMLHRKYPKAFESRRKTEQLMRSFRRDFQSFVRASERAALKGLPPPATEDVILAEQDLEETITSIAAREQSARESLPWGIGFFTVKGFEKYGKNEIGLDLSDNQTYYTERDEILGYLQAEGLSTAEIDLSRQPHSVIFEAFRRVRMLTVGRACPAELVFDPPKALAVV